MTTATILLFSAYIAIAVTWLCFRAREHRRDLQREAAEIASLEHMHPPIAAREAGDAAERNAAYEELAKRRGHFYIFRMQSDARPGWAASLTAQQIRDFGLRDNFEPTRY